MTFNNETFYTVEFRDIVPIQDIRQSRTNVIYELICNQKRKIDAQDKSYPVRKNIKQSLVKNQMVFGEKYFFMAFPQSEQETTSQSPTSSLEYFSKIDAPQVGHT